MDFAKFSDDETLKLGWRMSEALPPGEPSGEVAGFLKARRAEWLAIAPDPKLAELRETTERTARELDERIGRLQAMLGEAHVAAELDGGDPKAAAGLQRELGRAREERDAAGHRLGAIDRRIQADAADVLRRRIERARELSAECQFEWKARRAAALSRIQEFAAWLATFAADDTRLSTSAQNWSRSAAELAAPGASV